MKNFVVVSIWVLSVTAGIYLLSRYSNTAGPVGPVQNKWPSVSRIAARAGEASFLVFVHPKCACTRATLGELERLMPYLDRRAQTYIVVADTGLSLKEANGYKDQLQRRFPAAGVLSDDGNREANIFGSRTSGQTFLYDEQGQIVFNGGITPERGHMGDSEGRSRILNWAEGNVSAKGRSVPVFGCLLQEERSE